MINFFTEDIEFEDYDKNRIQDFVQKVIDRHYKLLGEVNYIFCSDKYILEVNKEYLNHDYFTDIISFDYSEGDLISGDIFISIDTVKDNAETFKVSFENELYRVIIHGILHYIGFKDKTDEEQEMMTKMENEALAMINI
ncbi:rRNA maturation RNase YbeY [Puteibacter caeruleilacunae]|nr:rRNA maturation RNase YbeY [Puteibacter caeruleilacunae]